MAESRNEMVQNFQEISQNKRVGPGFDVLDTHPRIRLNEVNLSKEVDL